MMGALLKFPAKPEGGHQHVTGTIVGWAAIQSEAEEFDIMVVMTDDGGLLSRWIGYDLEAYSDNEDSFTQGDRVGFYN
jgi:hypothetical protein